MGTGASPSIMLKLVRTYFMRFTPLFVGAFVLTAIRVGCDLMIPNLMSEVIDAGVANNDVPYIFQTGGVMLLWALGCVVARRRGRPVCRACVHGVRSQLAQRRLQACHRV